MNMISLDDETAGDVMRLLADQLSQGLRYVFLAIRQSSGEERKFLYGVLLHRHEAQDRIVTTDGRRLAMVTLVSPGEPRSDETPFPMRAIPYPACAKLVDVIELLNPPMCRLRFGEENLEFECDRFHLWCQPRGDFPDYLSILPDPKPPLRVTVNRETLLWALELAQTSMNRKVASIRFQMEAGKMTLEGISAEIGRSHHWRSYLQVYPRMLLDSTGMRSEEVSSYCRFTLLVL